MTEPAGDKPDLVIDLNFVPSWARNAPDRNPYSRGDGAERETDDRRERRGGDRRPERTERGFGDRPRRKPDRDRRGPPRPERPPAPGEARLDGRPSERSPAAPRDWDEPLPVEVDFLPDRRGLAPLARRLGLSGRSYSLFDVAALFLSKPDYYAVRVSLSPGEGQSLLYQCAECRIVFADEGRAVSHSLDKHFDRFYRKEEKDVEPPKGNFVSVARCGLSGDLIGPPNYHGYNDAVMDLYRARYSHMPVDQYRRRIENVHDAALIEQWKQKMSKQTVYRPADEADPARFGRLADVEAHFRERHAGAAVERGPRFIVSGTVSQTLEDGQIKRMIREAWIRENHFPLRMSIALRLAFRHLGLHLFKTASGGTFVTAICPNAIDPGQAVPVIREILEYLAANPGCTAQALAESIRPGQAADSPGVHEVRQQLRWMIDKGHVIEFSDGRLAVPLTSVRRVQHAKRTEPPKKKGGGPHGHSTEHPPA